jgi:hypothetical protein
MRWSKRSIVAVLVSAALIIILLLLTWDFLVINFIKSGTVQTP